MLKPAAYKAPSYVIQKLFRLLDVLKSERDKYSQAASTITDRQHQGQYQRVGPGKQPICVRTAFTTADTGTDNYYDQNVSLNPQPVKIYPSR